MLQIRFHGRGGQGVVTAAELLSVAAFLDGKHAQAFPSFGSERMGAPVMAFCRIHEKELRLREAVMNPDVLIIQDPTLLHHVDVFAGLASSGYVLINSSHTIGQLGIEDLLKTLKDDHVCALPASEMGLKHLNRPISNTPLLGGFAAITGSIRLSSLEAAIQQKFPGRVGDANVAAAREAYDYVTIYVEQWGVLHHACPD